MISGALLLFLNACGVVRHTSREPRPEAPAAKKEIKASSRNAYEKGVASWYGPKFHGRLTANGETYDMHVFTAAHRTLPFNTYVRVVNLDNGRSTVVRINDRGPFAKNRIIDLSKAAATDLGMIGPGTAHVALFVLKGRVPDPRKKDIKNATYTVQLGSFSQKRLAEMKHRQISGTRIKKVQVDGKTFFRLYYGTFKDKGQAESARKKLMDHGHYGYVKQLENG